MEPAMTTFDTLNAKFDAATDQTAMQFRPVPLTPTELELVCGGSPKGGWAPDDATISPKGGW